MSIARSSSPGNWPGQRLGVGAVIRRLGYLLEHYELADTATLAPLQAQLTATYSRLDPLLPVEGPHLSRWKLQLNVPAEELDSISCAP